MGRDQTLLETRKANICHFSRGTKGDLRERVSVGDPTKTIRSITLCFVCVPIYLAVDGVGKFCEYLDS